MITKDYQKKVLLKRQEEESFFQKRKVFIELEGAKENREETWTLRHRGR